MFNNDGVKNAKYGAPVQILANVELQESVGCRVPNTMGVKVGDRLIVKAGTPIHVDFTNLQTPVTAPTEGSAANAVLLHNVDVTDAAVGGSKSSKNGTALIFGFVNVNRLESDVKSQVTAGVKIGDVQFLNV